MDRILWWICVAILPCLVHGQEQRQALIEEIQKVPTDASGDWIIGGQVFAALPTTQINSVRKPTEGQLAAVEYTVRDGKRLATIIQPIGINAADVHDGPYLSLIHI